MYPYHTWISDSSITNVVFFFFIGWFKHQLEKLLHTDFSQVAVILINLHPMLDNVRRSERGNSAHSHLVLLRHTFMTVANRVCGEEQVL